MVLGDGIIGGCGVATTGGLGAVTAPRELGMGFLGM